MKISIYFDIKSGAWGGGNQFLKAVKKYFISNGVYDENAETADVVIFNSHHFLINVLKLKLKNPQICLIHRVDGPMVHYRGGSPYLDKLLFWVNNKIADGTIFQSHYSKNASYKLGRVEGNFDTIITNAPDSTIFNKNNRIEFSSDRKVKLVATSWSDNWRKGFDTLQWIDENLNFEKYEMLFIGNSPIKFKNIMEIDPVSSKDLAIHLKNSDIFIFSSKIESCSNSLLEGGHCGLPMVAYNSTGNPEIVKLGGSMFTKNEDIPKLLANIVNNYQAYTKNIRLPVIDEVGKMYFDFCQEVCSSNNPTKKINLVSYYYIITIVYIKQWSDKIYAIFSYFYRKINQKI